MNIEVFINKKSSYKIRHENGPGRAAHGG